jgi:formate dehydrogenase subunit gamma
MRSFSMKFCALSLLSTLAICTSAFAQTAAPTSPPAPASGGIQSVNINDVKPDASTLPGYAKQTNAERGAVQPGNNAPIWREVNSGQAGFSTLPNPEAGVLIQRTGEWWREIRNSQIIVYGSWLLLGMVAAIALFYWRRGVIAMDAPNTGRVIERFTSFERTMHWTMAISFVTLAVSGMVMMFGKYVLLPVFGSTLFGWLTYALKNLHNFIGPVFAVSLGVAFVVWARDNLPAKGDLAWLLKGGGLFSKGSHIASNRFNAGEKVWFWGGVFFLGFITIASGLVLNHLVPGMSYSRGNMQLAHITHAIATVLIMAMAMGHIYIGTLGTQDAYKAMRTGYVDEAWAKQHHEHWYEDIKAGKIPAQRTPNVPLPTRAGHAASSTI